MNSLERKRLRYLRRKEIREKKIIERSNKYASLDKAFCFHKVMFYANKCCNGVKWKKSTTNFRLHKFTIISNTCYNIKNNKYKVGKTYKFKINERGKIRNIDAPHIKDRLVHKVISNEILDPLYIPHLIYDNGASQKNKGFIFALYRLKDNLYKYYRKYGLNGYIVLIDYSNYFFNCSHEVIHDIHKKYIKNDDVIKVIEDYLFIDKGIALGVEIAQKEASIIPNTLDHFVRNKCFIERYMDDSIYIINDYNSALNILNKYINKAKELGIIINLNKTKIVSINNYFKYCKWHYKIFNSGKIVLVPNKSTIYRQRRRLRKMYKLYNMNKLVYENIDISKISFCAYLSIGNSYRYIKYLNNRFNRMIKEK
mgnify:CR=1 FL=1